MPVLSVGLLFLLSAGVHLALSVHMVTPIVHADEFGYLMGARYLARGGLPTGMPYSPGYSLLLVPLWWLSDSAPTVYRWALDVNAVLGGLTTVLLHQLARRLAPGARRRVWFGTAVAVSAYPALLLSSDIVQSENLVFPGFLVVCLLLWRAFEVPTARRWAAAAGATGLLFAVHERALAVAVVLVIVAAAFLRPWRVHARALAGAGAALALTLGAGELLTRYVTRGVTGYQLPPGGTTAGHLLHRLTSLSGLAHMGVELAGQGLYLLVGGSALFVLGVLALLGRRPWRTGTGGEGSGEGAPGWPVVPAGPAAFLLLTVLAEAALAAIFLASGSRIDDVIYGRYVEAFALPVLVVGALSAAATASRWSWRRWLWPAVAGALGLGGLAAAVAAYWGGVLRGAVVMSNVFAISELLRSTNARLSLAALAGAGLACLVVELGAFRLSVVAGWVAVVGLSVPAVVYGYSYVIDQSAGRLPQRSLPAAIEAIQSRFGGIACVSWDSAVPDPWTFYNTRLFAPQIRFPVFDSARRQVLPCRSGLVIAPHDFGTDPHYPGAKLVIEEPSPESLWVMPGRLQARLAAHPLRFGGTPGAAGGAGSAGSAGTTGPGPQAGAPSSPSSSSASVGANRSAVAARAAARPAARSTTATM